MKTLVICNCFDADCRKSACLLCVVEESGAGKTTFVNNHVRKIGLIGGSKFEAGKLNHYNCISVTIMKSNLTRSLNRYETWSIFTLMQRRNRRKFYMTSLETYKRIYLNKKK